MSTLTTDQISTIISALRARAKQQNELAEIYEKNCTDNEYMITLCRKNADEANALKEFFYKIKDRVFDSENYRAKITITVVL